MNIMEKNRTLANHNFYANHDDSIFSPVKGYCILLIMKLFELKNLTANWDMIPKQMLQLVAMINLQEGIFEIKHRLRLWTQELEGTSNA